MYITEIAEPSIKASSSMVNLKNPTSKMKQTPSNICVCVCVCLYVQYVIIWSGLTQSIDPM